MIASRNGAEDFPISPEVTRFIGKQMRQLREKRGQSEIEFATIIGFPDAECRALEQGDRDLNMREFLHIVSACGAPPSYFLFGISHESDQNSFPSKVEGTA